MDDASILTLLWTAIQVVLLLYVLVAWFGSAGGFTAPSCKLGYKEVIYTDHFSAFILVWHSLVAIFISVAGTLVMKKHRTPIGVGLFVGAIFVMINWTLTDMILIGGQIHNKHLMMDNCDKEGISVTADIFSLILSIFLFLLYVAFEVVLVKSKDELLGGGFSDSSGYPSSGFSSVDQHEEHLTAV